MDRKGIVRRLGGAGEFARQWTSMLAQHPAVRLIAGAAARAAAGFLLARAVIFGEYAPFGAAFSAALGAGGSALFGLLGAACGYLSVLQRVNGLKYVAICILIYTAGFVFRDTALGKKRWFMPLAATISSAAIGFVFVADAGFAAQKLAFTITEVAITALGSYFYQFLCAPRSAENARLRQLSGAVLLITLVISLVPITLLRHVSIGRMIATLLVMLAGFYGGAGLGSASGIALGLAVSASGGELQFCAIYGFSALISATFRAKGRILYAAMYFLVSAVASLWAMMTISPAAIYEAVLAAMLFLPVSALLDKPLERALRPAECTAAPARSNYGERVRQFTEARLSDAAHAFSELSRTLEGALRRPPQNPGNIAAVFDAPAQHICKKCALSGSCWERDYITTRDALNSAVSAMRERGRLEARDFPVHFSSRCIKIEEFIAEVNRELARFLYRQQCHSRVAESRSMVRRQYAEMSGVLEDMARSLAADPQFDERAETRIAALLAESGESGAPCVYRDAAGHIHIEIEHCTQAEALPALGERIAQAIGIPLTVPQRDGDSVIMRQKEPLTAALGVAVNKKQGAAQSGDSGSYFRMEDGRLCVILSDGMGSGHDAARISAATVTLLERFLQSGIDPRAALTTINSALVLQGEESGGFTTLDFLRLDLYTGNAEFYKLGSAPGYIKRGQHVRKLCGATLPAGVPCPSPQEPDRMHQRLHFGDFVVLATDGIADAGDDEWLTTLLSAYEGRSAKQLAGEIMAGACAKYGRADDMTVMVVYVDKTA